MYVEFILLFNSCINMLIIIVCSHLVDEQVRKMRAILFSTLSSVCTVLFDVTIWTTIASLIILQFAFQKGRSFTKLLLLLSMSFVLGGMLTVVQTYATSTIEFYVGLLLSIIFVVVVLKSFIKRFQLQQLVKRYEQICTLHMFSEQFHCKGFIDTGNQSLDPLTGRPIHFATIQLLATKPHLQHAFFSWNAERPHDLSMFPTEIRRHLQPLTVTTIEQQSLVLACSCSLNLNGQQLAHQLVVFVQKPMQFHQQVQMILNASVLQNLKGDRYCFEV